MNNNLIGGQITKFRKAAGMTQEELGRAVGVSTQAVSRWECGGAPDVALLPAVADTLHVTIDALFGREGGTPENMEELMAKWITNLPEEGMLERVVRLLWELTRYAIYRQVKLPEMGYLEKCEMMGSHGEEVLMRTLVLLEQGFLTGVFAEDFSYFAIFPEPAAGYDAYFIDNDSYRGLFSALARPGSLELLLYLYSEKERFYTAEAVAKNAGREVQETRELLELLRSVNLLSSLELELETGTVNAYKVNDNGSLVPMLYMSRYLLQSDEGYHMCWNERTKPWLRRARGQAADAGGK